MTNHATNVGDDIFPEASLPAEERDYLKRVYDGAKIILEYGSGGSTALAARQHGKYIISVESDRDWALDLQRKLDEARFDSHVIVHHVDIGDTGRWGRPKNDRAWRYFHRYPVDVWSEPYFKQPEVILIDGRLRPACLINACLRATRPMTVLFDDYATRPMYHAVEAVIRPLAMIGRMAVFSIVPDEYPPFTEDLFLDFCTLASFDGQTVDYTVLPKLPTLDAIGWSGIN